MKSKKIAKYLESKKIEYTGRIFLNTNGIPKIESISAKKTSTKIKRKTFVETKSNLLNSSF